MLRPAQLAVQRLVLQRAVQKRPARIHPAVLPAENRLRQHPQGLRIPLEAAPWKHELLQSAFAGMTEGRMPKVMSKVCEGRCDDVLLSCEVKNWTCSWVLFPLELESAARDNFVPQCE